MSEEKSTTEPLRATVSLSSLMWMMNRARTFASSDPSIPVLNAIRFFERDGRLHAVATDRYRLIMLRAHEDKSEVSQGFEAVIRIDVIKSLNRALVAPNVWNATVTLTADDPGRMSLRVDELPMWGDLSLKFDTIPNNYEWSAYPPVEKLLKFDDLDMTVPAGGYAFNPHYLAELNPKKRSGKSIWLQPGGPKGSMFFSADDDEIGLLMPVNFESGTRADFTETWSWLNGRPVKQEASND